MMKEVFNAGVLKYRDYSVRIDNIKSSQIMFVVIHINIHLFACAISSLRKDHRTNPSCEEGSPNNQHIFANDKYA